MNLTTRPKQDSGPRRWCGRLRPSSVKGQIVLGFTLLVVVLVAVVAASALLARQHQRHHEQMESSADVAMHLSEAKLRGTVAVAQLQQYAISGNEATVSQVRSSLASGFRDMAAARDAAAQKGEDTERLDAFLTSSAVFPQLVDEVITLRQDGDAQGALRALAKTDPMFVALEPQLDALIQDERAEASDLRALADREASLALWLLLVSGATGTAFALAASFVIARSIIKPLAALEAAALRVAAGDLDAHAAVRGPREIASLSDALGRMTAAVLDASKRRELEEALRRSEEHFRKLTETTTAATFIVQGTNLRYVNRAAQEMTGYSRDELLDMPFWEIMDPEFQPRSRASVEACNRGEDIVARHENKIRTKSGEMRWVDFAGVAIDYEGKPALLGTAFDITERRRTEEALREAETKYRTLVEQIPAVTYLDALDSSRAEGFRPVYMSPQIETLVGYSPSELVANEELWYEVVHPEDRQRVRAAESHHYATGEPISGEYRLVARDGRVVWVRDESVMVQGAAGEVSYSQGVLLDITARKRADEALREAEATTAACSKTSPWASTGRPRTGRSLTPTRPSSR